MSQQSVVDSLLDRGDRLICVADQRPFPVRHNTFCVLTPLLTVAGQVFDPDRLEELFPHYGRIWWMLLDEMTELDITPGMIWTAQIEEGIRQERHVYQARRASVEPGAPHYLQVLDVEKLPEVSEVARGFRVPGDAIPVSNVLLRSEGVLMGPFSASWIRVDREIGCSVPAGADPVVYRMREGTDDVLDFQFLANQFDAHRHSEAYVDVSLAPESIVERLRSDGDALDAASDRQVMNWAMQYVDLSNRDAHAVKAFVDAMQSKRLDGLAPAPPGRLARIEEICREAERVLGLGADLAGQLAQQPAFKTLVEQNLDEILQQRISDEITLRRKEIESEIADLESERDELAGALRTLKTTYEERRTEEKETFRADQAEVLEALRERESAVRQEAEALEQREKEMEARLERVLAIYEERADELADELVASLPLLRRMGLGGGISGETRTRSSFGVPTFLSTERAPGGLSEAEFVEQFARVAQSRGYVFDPDDLANMHINVKMSLWTIIAGPSGTGKSTLPRLYAEALGVAEELLWIPVRPDWMDDRDVLGAYNALAGRYEPSSSGLVDRLIAASEDYSSGRGGLYLVCLDEMNLARVEHYFAQFLSIAELPQPRRRLDLFAPGLVSPDDPYGPYRRLPISPFVRFVGTVNVDETTHFFSPKVIDRAGIMILEEPRLDRAASSADEESAVTGLAPVHAAEYAAWTPADWGAPDPDVSDLLEAIHQLLRRQGTGLGFRAQDRIMRYLAGARELLPASRALDLAIAQIVLPRVRTYDAELVDELAAILPGGRFARSAALLDRMSGAEGDFDFFQVI